MKGKICCYICWLIDRITPFLLRCRKDFNKSPMIILTTIVLAIFAAASICQTQSIISQQRSEEFVRLRAYLHPQKMEITKSSHGENYYDIHLLMKNSGLTPAKGVIYQLLINGKPVKESVMVSDKKSMIIGSTNLGNTIIYFDKNRIGQSNNYELEYKYSTYRKGDCYSGSVTGTFEVNQIPNESFNIETQDDISIPCDY